MKKNRGETHSPFLEAQNLFGGVGLKLPYIYPLSFFSWSKIEIGNKGVVGFMYLFSTIALVFYSVFFFGKKQYMKGDKT
jgi:hypothetical protein